MTDRSRMPDVDGGYVFFSSPAWLNGNQYVPGATYTVTLFKPGATLNGFLAYAEDGAGTRLGTMAAGTGSQLKTCPAGSTVTHSDGSAKSSVTFDWTAPAGGGDLSLRGIAYDSVSRTFYNPALALMEAKDSPSPWPTPAPSSPPTMVSAPTISLPSCSTLNNEMDCRYQAPLCAWDSTTSSCGSICNFASQLQVSGSFFDSLSSLLRSMQFYSNRNRLHAGCR